MLLNRKSTLSLKRNLSEQLKQLMGLQELIEIFQQEWAFRALLASTMVGLMCGVLGCFIVLRNMSMIGDALSHAILPGVVFAFMLVGYSALGFFVGAVLAGLFAAVAITWIQRNVKTKNDAAIGIIFTAMFSIGVMGISKISKEGGVHLDLKDFLFGNSLGVSDQDLILTAVITVYVLLSIIIFYRYLFVTTFQPVIAETMGISVSIIHYFLMLLLSFAVVASLQTVGVILVVAMLITPASTALLLTSRLPWVLTISGIIGLISAFLGLVVSIIYDTTPGPAMAIVATVFYFAAALFSPSKGLIFRWLQKRRLKLKIQTEDIMKQAHRLQEKGILTLAELDNRLGFSKATLNSHLRDLRVQGFFEREGLELTTKGKNEAKRLVRAHRLWESYLVTQMGLTEEQIHEDAEKYEHLLTEEILDEVDAKLGFPTTDPHGSPIPTKRGVPDFALINLEVLRQAKIATEQVNEHITAQLWQFGLLPDTTFEIKKKGKEKVEIRQDGKTIVLPRELASQINIV